MKAVAARSHDAVTARTSSVAELLAGSGLSRAEAPESEDRAFRLWGVKLLGADGRDLQLARYLAEP